MKACHPLWANTWKVNSIYFNLLLKWTSPLCLSIYILTCTLLDQHGSCLPTLKNFRKASAFYTQSWYIQYVPTQKVHLQPSMRRFPKHSEKSIFMILAILDFLVLIFHGSTCGTCHETCAMYSLFSSTGEMPTNWGFFRYSTSILAKLQIKNSI